MCLGGGSLGSHAERVAVEWVSAIVIPHVKSCSQSPDSKQRRLALKMVEVILINNVCTGRITTKSSVGQSVLSPQRELIEIALALKDDPVANVRLNVGRLFCIATGSVRDDYIPIVAKGLEEQLQNENERRGEGDRDVLFFAKRALAKARTSKPDEVPSALRRDEQATVPVGIK